MDNIGDIASVDGVDGVFIGPSDLSASLGFIGQPGRPEVQAAIEDAVRKIAEANKPSGVLTLNVDEAQRYIDMGICFVAVGADTAILTDNARALSRRFKS